MSPGNADDIFIFHESSFLVGNDSGSRARSGKGPKPQVRMSRLMRDRRSAGAGAHLMEGHTGRPGTAAVGTAAVGTAKSGHTHSLAPDGGSEGVRPRVEGVSGLGPSPGLAGSPVWGTEERQSKTLLRKRVDEGADEPNGHHRTTTSNSSAATSPRRTGSGSGLGLGVGVGRSQQSGFWAQNQSRHNLHHHNLTHTRSQPQGTRSQPQGTMTGSTNEVGSPLDAGATGNSDNVRSTCYFTCRCSTDFSFFCVRVCGRVCGRVCACGGRWRGLRQLQQK